MKEYVVYCKICNQKFISNHPALKVCSDECRMEREKRKRKKELDKKRKKSLKITVPCKICGKPVFKTWTGRIYSQSHYHENCIVEKCKKLLSKQGTDEYREVMKLASNHGITKRDILEGLYD